MEHHEVHIEPVNSDDPPLVKFASVDEFEAEEVAADLRRQPRWFPNVVRVVSISQPKDGMQ
jgi:hypothetical protein